MLNQKFSISILILIVITLSVHCLSGQGDTNELIERELRAFDSDSARLDYLYTKVQEAGQEDALSYLIYGKRLATKQSDLTRLAWFLREEGIMKSMSGEYLNGATAFLKSDSIYHILNDTLRRAGAMTNAGLAYYYAGAYDQALSQYFRADEIYRRLNVSKDYSRLLNNLAMCLKHAEQFDDAQIYYRKSIAVKKAIDDKRGIANTYHNLGLLYSEVGKMDESIEALDSALLIYQEIGNEKEYAASALSLGKVLMDGGRIERAYTLISQSHDYFKMNPEHNYELYLSTADMGMVLKKLNQPQRAREFLNQALAMNLKTDNLKERRDLLLSLAGVDVDINNHRSASSLLLEAIAIGDSLNTENRLALIEEMQTRFKVREKEKEIVFAEKELESQEQISKSYRIGLIAALGALILIGALGYFLWLSRRELKEKNRVVEEALEHRELLLKEIHHRVKNNLQVISSLLSMQSFGIEDEKTLDLVREGKDRVKSMALIHQSLYQDENLIGVRSSEYIQKLSQSLFQSYNVDPDRIQLTTDIEELQMDVDTMIPLGLILNELISNALKYAFEDGEPGEIQICLKQRELDTILEVKDDGKGVPGHFDLDQTTSMGYLIVKDFCQKLRATIDVEAIDGTRIRIKIPKRA